MMRVSGHYNYINSGLKFEKLKIEIENKTKVSSSEGEGPIDAIFKSIEKVIPNKAQLTLYQVNAITKGIDSQAEVNVRLEESGFSVQGQGKDFDTMVASAKAYVSALNKLALKRKKSQDTKENFLSPSNNVNKHVI